MRDHRDEFYPDGNNVYQRGPDGLYRWYSDSNGIVLPPGSGTGPGVPPNNLPPATNNVIVIPNGQP
jgi:hypothetical protein